jgi:tetratricopeptide (TPR) repeat protein
MRRLFLTGFLALAGMGLFAQSVDKAKDLLKANKIADAKTQIDGALAVEKNQKSSEAWYYKLKIYNAIAAGPLSGQYPDARQQAFDALKKYVEVDDKKLLLLQIDGYKPVNEIYQGFFQIGANDYNSGKYDSALTNFTGAIETSSFMNAKGWTTLKLDTTSTLYAGISAEKAGKKDTAAMFYGRLADARIDKINNSNMIDIYKWLVDYYSNTKKDDAMTQKYLGIAEKIFPDDLFWPSTRLEILRAKGNKDSLFVEYDTIVAHFPKNYLFFFNFGLELYQYAGDTSSGQRPANADTLIAKAQVMLKSCLALQPDYPQAALVLGQISYNQGVDLQAQVKKLHGATPDVVKQRTDLRAATNKKFDEAIPYFEKVDQDLGSKGKLKMEEKSALKDAYDLLITIYEAKGPDGKAKADAYTNKYNNVDKDH